MPSLADLFNPDAEQSPDVQLRTSALNFAGHLLESTNIRITEYPDGRKVQEGIRTIPAQEYLDTAAAVEDYLRFGKKVPPITANPPMAAPTRGPLISDE